MISTCGHTAESFKSIIGKPGPILNALQTLVFALPRRFLEGCCKRARVHYFVDRCSSTRSRPVPPHVFITFIIMLILSLF